MSAPAPAPAPLLPPLALAAGATCVAGAVALAHCALLSALITRPICGLYAIIIHLAVADLLLLVTTIGPEIWSYNSRSWVFGNSACVAHQGLKVFASTASLYLVTAIALHAIATINLEDKVANRKANRGGQNEDEEIRSSRHSLVAASNSSTPRTLNVDYRQMIDAKILVTRPTVFVWVLATSLSVPEFTLASTVHLENDVFVCTLIDSNHSFYMHSLTALFNLFLPMFIMTSAFALIVVKLKARKRFCEISDEPVAALKLSLGLIMVCLVLCAPRSIVNAYTEYSLSSNEYDRVSLVESVRRSQPSDRTTAINLAAGGANLLATLIRPILCLTILPSLRNKFKFHLRGGDVENV